MAESEWSLARDDFFFYITGKGANDSSFLIIFRGGPLALIFFEMNQEMGESGRIDFGEGWGFGTIENMLTKRNTIGIIEIGRKWKRIGRRGRNEGEGTHWLGGKLEASGGGLSARSADNRLGSTGVERRSHSNNGCVVKKSGRF
jgi:hypothetical protein